MDLNKYVKWLGIVWLMPIFVTIPLNNVFSILSIIFLPIVIIYNLSNYGRIIEKSLSHISLLSFLLYILFVGLLQSVVNEQFEKYFILFSQGFLVFFILTSIYTYRDFNLIANSILFFCVISFLIGLIQFQLGIGQEYLQYTSGEIEFYLRPIPAGFDPNYYFINIIFPLVYSLYKIRLSKSKKSKLFFATLVLVFIMSTIFTSSKAALLVLFVICFTFIFKSIKALIISGVIFFIGYLFLLPMLFEFFPYAFARYEVLFSGDFQNVTTNRNIMWGISFDFSLSNPLFGVGLGQMVQYYTSILYFNQIGGQTTHNTFIHTIAETGIIGFTLWVVPLLSQLKKSFDGNKLIFLVLISTSIMMMSIDAGYYKTFFVYLSISYIITKNEKDISNSTL